MKVEFSAFPKAFSGNVAVLVAADKQLQATAKTLDKGLGGRLSGQWQKAGSRGPRHRL